MRSLVNKKNKSRQNQLILGGVLILLMIFSTLGYALNSQSNKNNTKKIKYSGIEFLKDNADYWNFEIQGNSFSTKYNPAEIENIEFNGILKLSDYIGKPFYFISETKEPIAEVARNFENFVLRMQKACLNDETCNEDLPIKNCFKDNILIITESKNEAIYQQGNCVFINSSFANQTRYADKFIFSILGI